MNEISSLCKDLLINHKQKINQSTKQQLKIIFIASSICINRHRKEHPLNRKEHLYLLNGIAPAIFLAGGRYLPLNFIKSILQSASELSEKNSSKTPNSKKYPQSFVNNCLKWIEEDNRQSWLDNENLIDYCKLKKEALLSLNLQGRMLSDLDIEKMARFCPKLKELNLQSTNIASLEVLKGLLQLERLDLRNCNKLSQEEFLKIKELFPNLKELNLALTNIASLKGLKGLQLEKLDLASCINLSQKEILKIKELFPNLKELNLAATKIASLEVLTGLFQLERLNLGWCSKLPQEEFIKIKELYPHVDIL